MLIKIDFHDLEIEVECNRCGSSLCTEFKDSKNTLFVNPCGHCTEESFVEGMKKGEKKCLKP